MQVDKLKAELKKVGLQPEQIESIIKNSQPGATPEATDEEMKETFNDLV